MKKLNFDASSTLNYRPISKLSFISKLLENQFRSLLYRLEIFDPFHSGFQRQHSTETTPIMAYNDFLMEETIDHKILLNRLKVLAGVSGNALDWFSSYSSNRTISVRTDRFSNIASLPCRVPQGRHFLFSVFIKDIYY